MCPTTPEGGNRKPLSGIQILDLTRVLAGPWATQHLADLGATVIKVERPGTGDESRGYGPFLGAKTGPRRMTPMYLCANRNKKSITVNLADEAGQTLVRDLALRCDVLVENYKVGDLARYGLDYDSLAALNPRLVYCSLTGYGQSGPFKERPGYDPVMQAMVGMMSVTGHPGGEPTKCGPSVIDLMTGMYAASAVQGALYHREKTSGRGQYIDVALLDCGFALLAQQVMHTLIQGEPAKAAGNFGNSGRPAGAYRCQDGYIVISPGSEGLYKRFCAALERPDLATDPRFVTNTERLVNGDALKAVLDAEFARWTVERLCDVLVNAGVPASPVYNIRQALDMAQSVERGVMVDTPVVDCESFGLLANPIRYSDTPLNIESVPPVLGEHTDEVLRDLLGLDAPTLARLHGAGVV
ncbi:MAG: CoA transferase [Hydrogenophaga sp.]|nr:CoA transferase [Hydrogenophaga sp.]MDO9437590.1 CoA transferase [Hydrogenophaga sp.]